ncbi:VOC family protein [Rhodanobacter sp. Col0626]|uniref:VOC family protein n=1 Tax=Rhodanobacter sp. Col0626 TaxID=3415679 RepID=UPI003CF5B936
MRTFLFSILVASLLAGFGLPSGAHAASFHGSSYVTLAVPDLPQAVAFFRNVLDCEPVEVGSVDSAGNQPQRALLICETDTVVELSGGHAVNTAALARDVPVQFFASDVTHADQWLRREGVKVVGAPVTPTTGPQAGMTLVNFVAPWGQSLQLVGLDNSQITAVP